MTDREKAIIMAHTGVCMLTGDKFQIFHKYIEDIMDRPIMTHEIERLADVIKEKSKADFIALCADDQESCEDCIKRSDIGLTDFEIIKCKGDYREALKILLEKIAKAPSVKPQEPTYISELVQKAYEDGKKDGYVQAKIDQKTRIF